MSPSRLLQSLKGSTAREANLILGRTGETFWQAESYDHWLRTRVAAHRYLHRRKPGEGWTRSACVGLSMVERISTARERRDESRRCRHECLRHEWQRGLGVHSCRIQLSLKRTCPHLQSDPLRAGIV